MTEIITYRVSGTGAWGYEFYDRSRNRIGSVSSVVSRSAPVRINGCGISWYSRFEMDTTIIPGIGRRVNDGNTGKEVYRLIYWKPGLYQVRAGEDSVQVEIRNGQYLFGKPGMPVAAMTVRIDREDLGKPENIPEAEPYFRTTVFDNISDVYRMMVLSFPMLRFY